MNLDPKQQAFLGEHIRSALNGLAPVLGSALGIDVDPDGALAATVWACCLMAIDAHGAGGLEDVRTLVDQVEQHVVL